MDRKEFIAGLLNRIGVFTKKTFNERLATQKIIFILQTKMKDFPTLYNFNLYISGPYSRKFTSDFYAIGDTSKYGKIEFNDQILNQKIEDFVTLIKPYISNRAILELLGTLIYLEKIGYTGDELKEKLQVVKSGFDEKQYAEAFVLAENINKVFT